MTSKATDTDRPQVLIVGGGVAGLEALLALHEVAGDRLELTMAAPEPEFTYRPFTVEEPFTDVPAQRRSLEPIAAELSASFIQAALVEVDVGARCARFSDGSELHYDALIVCVGGRARAAFEGVTTFGVSREPVRVDELLRRATESRRIAFVVPPGVSWPLPIYELALMTERRAREHGVDVRISVITPESGPLILFGTTPSGAVAELLTARGIEVRTHSLVRAGEDGRLIVMPSGDRLEEDVVVALPAIDGPAIPGLPADERGFLPIDEHARVVGADHVYAAGDGTTFPIKQGGLATQQADAAAEHVAASFGAELEPRPFHPVLRGLLLTGEESLSMSQDLTGGSGEGASSADYLWWPPHKISGRYLAAYLADELPHEPEPPSRPIEVEVALPKEWHSEPMALDPYSPVS
jgi:sulfide:quinone oxidoreductase